MEHKPIARMQTHGFVPNGPSLEPSTKDNKRLYPSRFSSRYYHLTRLREALAACARTCLSKQGNRLLVDFGCGSMPYRPIFAAHAISYVGLDITENPRADVHVASHGAAPLRSACADIVLSTQVLEHVSEPATYLSECHRILKPGGLLILSTHGYWIYHPDPQDLWRWTNEGLRRIVAQAGFEIENYQGVMGLVPSALQLLQDGLSWRVPRFVRPLFFYCMQILIMATDALESDTTRRSEACVFVLLARKQPCIG